MSAAADMDRPLPLAGVCVVEIGHSLAAPYAGMILGALGAEVIKIESAQGGDYARDWGPPFVDGAAALFHAVNHGKASIAMSLSDPEQAARLRELIRERADVVLQNLKAGGTEKYGLGAEAMLRDKPSLVYCNLGAFGSSGPWRDKPGYDPLVQAVAGLMSFMGSPGEPLSRIPVSVNDMGTGLWAAIGVLAALFRRQASGAGEIVSVSLYETAIAWGGIQIADYLASGVLPGRWGSGTAAIVPHQAFACADGTIMVAAGNDRLFRRLCEVLGTNALADDPRFATNGARVSHRAELIALLHEAFARAGSAHWLAALDAAGIPCGPIQTLDQVVAHAQTEALDLLRTTDDGAATVVGLPVSFGGQRPAATGRTPKLGEHNHLLAGTHTHMPAHLQQETP
ncbi:CaiB/BaiF CoA transferase family protein [Cupriavidus basilensis]|uniref:CaiB/BaiF CoA transferase family protein n=1 Tax=Cupriavidus basilensis TaxID=68895 RepID=UPI0009E2FADD|nr:CoA transferase [Cupriavidus basilensis]